MATFSCTPYTACAIIGNFYQESTVNPGLWEGRTVGSPGYGLGQWTNNAETTRRTRLFNWLSENGYPQDSGVGQLNYLVHENIWYGSGTLLGFMQSTSTDLDELTYLYMRYWEGIPDDGSLSYRRKMTRYVYNYIRNHTIDYSKLKWIKGNRYLSEKERLNNALICYNILTGGISPPEPPTPPHPPTPHPTGKAKFLFCAKRRKNRWIASI